MSGAVFFPKKTASTGAAPITAFLPPIPSRLTAFVAGHENVTNGFVRDNEIVAPLNVNQWTIYNTQNTGGANAVTATLGAMTTAPDGTNTAQRIVEAATTSGHYLTAVNPHGTFTPHGPWRLAAFAKAGERTRIVLQLANGISGGAHSSTVFDLANGVVAVPGIAVSDGTNPGWVAVADGILSYGNGWYLCWIDVICSYQNGLVGFFKLDAGTGNAAQNSSYLGDVTKGLNVWKTSCMPTYAFGMSGQAEFFDDFLVDSVDHNDTNNPSFNWFVHNTTPVLFGLIPNTANGQFVVANSALTCTDPGGVYTFNQQGQGQGVTTASWLGPSLGGFIDQGHGAFYDVWNSGRTYAVGEVKAYPSVATGSQGTSLYISLINSNLNNQPDISPSAWSLYVGNDAINNADSSTPGPGYVGRAFAPDGLLEARQRWPATSNINIGIGVNIYPIFWMTNTTDITNNKFSAQYRHYNTQDELTEVGAQQDNVATKHVEDLLGTTNQDQNSPQRSWYSYKVWNNLTTYSNGYVLWFNNVLYQSLQANNLNHEPDLTLGVWWALASDPLSATSPPNANTKQADFSLYHTYAHLQGRLDDQSKTGISLQFFDGILVQPNVNDNLGGQFIYGPPTSANGGPRDVTSPGYHTIFGTKVYFTINGTINAVSGIGSDTDFLRYTR